MKLATILSSVAYLASAGAANHEETVSSLLIHRPSSSFWRFLIENQDLA
jgi:hypothetical protein